MKCYIVSGLCWQFRKRKQNQSVPYLVVLIEAHGGGSIVFVKMDLKSKNYDTIA